ncbi:MAG: 6-phosphofructokinase [Chthonomonadales bacterium]|nr:6-phosphofructokinase [Chthonomonadales bacterium]
MRKVGVLTSGGDAPGMNAALRAVVRSGVAAGVQVVGIERGFQGLMAGSLRPMDAGSVSNIINRGGTILRSARSEEFKTAAGQARAAQVIEREAIDGLVLIGGDGTYRGGLAINSTCGVRVVGIPGTIDNDIPGTRYTIGFDTAINTAMDAIDRVRDTSASHDRVFVVEVMGRHNGFIAMEVGLAAGAEAVIIPECPCDMIGLCEEVMAWNARGKMSCIIIVAEGAASAADVATAITQVTRIETRLTVLGHIQRGGSPSARDRALATRFGHHAVQLLREGATNVMVGVQEGSEVVASPLEQVLEGRRDLNLSLFDVVRVMAT